MHTALKTQPLISNLIEIYMIQASIYTRRFSMIMVFEQSSDLKRSIFTELKINFLENPRANNSQLDCN